MYGDLTQAIHSLRNLTMLTNKKRYLFGSRVLQWEYPCHSKLCAYSGGKGRERFLKEENEEDYINVIEIIILGCKD